MLAITLGFLPVFTWDIQIYREDGSTQFIVFIGFIALSLGFTPWPVESGRIQ